MFCASSTCGGTGSRKFNGLCPKCWLKLTDDQRAELRGPPGPPDVTEIHEHTHINPPVPRWLTFAIGLAGGLVGTVLVMVLGGLLKAKGLR